MSSICRICESPHTGPYFSVREMMFGFRDQFPYFECSDCGCIQIEKVPENLAKYYGDGYYSFRHPGAFESYLKRQCASGAFGEPNLVWSVVRRLIGSNHAIDSIRRLNVPKTAAILDAGCGHGDLLLDLHSVGFTNLTGADPFAEKDLMPAPGVTIWKKDVTQLDGSFDVVMFHLSFEHITNPIATMRSVARLLTPSGAAILRVPVAAFAWRHYGVDWVQLDAPRHIFVPSARSMEVLANKAGLRSGNIIYESTAFQFWGSEQYRQDIPLHDKRTHIRSFRKVLFPDRKIRSYRLRAQELNRNNDGDIACFYFHRQ